MHVGSFQLLKDHEPLGLCPCSAGGVYDLFWHEPLKCALEISSMGIRVDEKSLDSQLTKAGCDERRKLPFHKMLLAGELPLTIGGGIGQSRLCMLLLAKAHVGEVQVSLWDDETMKVCRDGGLVLL